MDWSELPTLQNLAALPVTSALIPIYFATLQRAAGPFFRSIVGEGEFLAMGPYEIKAGGAA